MKKIINNSKYNNLLRHARIIHRTAVYWFDIVIIFISVVANN